MIQLELKGPWPRALLTGGARVPRWTTDILDDLDRDIRSVFGDGDIITPDKIRGDATTLEAAVLTNGWPSVDDVRGKVLFFFDYGDNEYVRDNYRGGRPSLQGRVAFTTPPPGQPDSAFIMVNDPRGAHSARITGLVERGYLVRTRADDPVSTAKANEHSRVDAALNSGAHMISTDFPRPGLAFRWGDGRFVAQLPGGDSVRPNPAARSTSETGPVSSPP